MCRGVFSSCVSLVYNEKEEIDPLVFANIYVNIEI